MGHGDAGHARLSPPRPRCHPAVERGHFSAARPGQAFALRARRRQLAAVHLAARLCLHRDQLQAMARGIAVAAGADQLRHSRRRDRGRDRLRRGSGALLSDRQGQLSRQGRPDRQGNQFCRRRCRGRCGAQRGRRQMVRHDGLSHVRDAALAPARRRPRHPAQRACALCRVSRARRSTATPRSMSRPRATATSCSGTRQAPRGKRSAKSTSHGAASSTTSTCCRRSPGFKPVLAPPPGDPLYVAAPN